MSNTIEMDIPATVLRGAVKRMFHLIETGYLPAEMKSDLETLIHGAMAWDASRSPLSPHQRQEEHQ